MTKEAKIGMLTGLGVIVAIGVLLSEYLGDRNTGPSAVPVATGKMAGLPVGPDYRQQVMAPVSVPAMTPAGGGERTQLPGGGLVASPIATGPTAMPPAMFAAQPDTGPNVSAPVAPLPGGPTLMDGRSGGGPPILTLDNTVTVGLVTPAARLTPYTILPGDNLAKIAKKFYNSSKNSDVARIVAANPTLKDASTPLIANKKLMIPVLTSAAPAAPLVVHPVDPGVVSLPGGGTGPVPIPGVIQPPKPGGMANNPPKPAEPQVKPDAPKPAKTYVVKSGDTLERIARLLAPTKVTETVGKLVNLNGIKDVSKLKVGQVLKVPA